MIIESEEKAEVDYQTFMLQENVIPGLLSTTIRYVDNQSCYRYDISGKVSLQSKYEKSKLTEKEMVEKIGYNKIWDCGLIKYTWTDENS